MSVRVLIAEHDTGLRNQLREMLGTLSDCEIVGLARDGQEAIQMAMQLVPNVAILSRDLPGISGLRTCEILSALAPDVMSVITSDSQSQDGVDSAMRSGARAVVAWPLDPARLSRLVGELDEVRKRQESPEVLDWRHPSKFPKIISITGAKGGVGKSTIAVNLAVVLAKRLPNKVALVDLYTQFGDIAAMLNITPKRTIAEMECITDEFDAGLVQNYMTKHSSGVHVLVTSVKPVPLGAASTECLDNLLYMLKRMYRYVIMDVPPYLHEATLHALAHSNLILLVSNLFDVTTATDTKQIYDALQQEHISKESIKIVLNRVLKANRLRPADIEKMFDCGILAQIPNDRRLVTAINQGIPLVLNDGDSPVGKGLALLADVIENSTSYASGGRSSSSYASGGRSSSSYASGRRSSSRKKKVAAGK